MALFKIYKGNDTQKLTNQNYSGFIPKVDGHCYFDTSTGLFYIDAQTGVDEHEKPIITRSPLNAFKAGFNLNGKAIGDSVYFIKGKTSDTVGHWTGQDSRIQSYYDGLTILYVPAVAGASTTTLNINGYGEKTCYYNNNNKLTTHYSVGIPILLTYINGTWRRADYDSNTVPAIIYTGAGTAAKTASCSNYKLAKHNRIQVILVNTNSAKGALTLNINGTGAKPIYINGTVSSSSNCILPNGSYNVYYDGTNYYFRTDGLMTGDITGNAVTATSTQKLKNVGRIDTINKLDDFIEGNTFQYATVSALDGLNGLSKNDGIILSAPWSDTRYGHQIYLDDSGYNIAHRYKTTNKDANNNNISLWSAWKYLIDSNNYTDYTVTKTGGGASGTWGINITGSATKLGTSNIGSTIQPIYLAAGVPKAIPYTIQTSVPSGAIFTDTKNTAGSVNTNTKIYLIGATSQAANPQTYSNNQVFSQNGTLSATGVGVDKYIAYPGGGQFTTTTSSIKGFCKIILPVSWTSTMLSFKIDIYNYTTNESVEYLISGYNYNSSTPGWHNCSAICLGKAGAAHSNLSVRFGHDGTKCVIAIGETTTVWSYPQVIVHDVLLGYSNFNFDTWNDGWSIVFSETALTTISTTISNTHIGNGISWNNISGKPSTFTPSSHTHPYLPLSGGTLTGTLNINNTNGIKVNSHNADLKVWEVVGNAGSWNSEYGFYEKYNGTKAGNDNSLELFAGNQTGTHISIREIRQDGKITWKTNNTFSKPINGSITGNAATATKVKNKLTIAGKEYDGSSAVSVSLTDLGLSRAMRFIGTTTALADGSTGTPIIASGQTSYAAANRTAGDVILNTSNNYEYIWTGSAWQVLGPGGSYDVAGTAAGLVNALDVNTSSAGNATTTFVSNITQTNGKIAVTKSSLDTSGTWSGKAVQDGNGNVITSKYVTLDTNQTISGQKTFSKEIILNQNYLKVIGRRYIFINSSDFNYTNLTPNNATGNADYMKAVLKTICSKYPGCSYPIIIGNLTPNSAGPVFGHIYDTSDTDSNTGLPRYSTFLFNNLNAGLKILGTYNYNYYHRQVLDDKNYNNYTPTKTGGGATGTWAISITGKAATADIANSVDWNNVANKPINFKAYFGSLTSGGWAALNGKSNSPSIAISYNQAAASWNSGTYSSSLVWGVSDTRGLLDCSYNTPIVTFGGASFGGATNDNPKWYYKLQGTSGQIYTFPSSSKTLCANDGSNASGTWGISITGNAATATTASALVKNIRMEYGWDGLNYFNINGTAGNGAKVNDTPTTAWWHILRFNHANSAGYYTDLAVPFNDKSLYYKRIQGGSVKNGGWVKVLDSLNYNGYALPLSGGTLTGLLKANGGISLDNTTAREKGLKYILGIKAYSDGGNIIYSYASDVRVGNAATADLLKNVGANCTTEASTWNADRGGTVVYGQKWKMSNQTYTPEGGSPTPLTNSGDFSFYIKPSSTSNTLTANMAIDGEIVAHGGFIGTATKAKQLATARTISLTNGATGSTNFDGSKNVSISVDGLKEAYLQWGGKNLTGSYGPIDAAMIPVLGANRLAFMPANAIEIQYSTNNGTTWATYNVNDATKINLFNGTATDLYIGGASTTKTDKTAHQLRIIITTDLAQVYTALNKFCIYCSTNGSSGCWCTIDAKTKANVDSGTDTWTTFANKVSISGWSGYNIINTSNFTTYGNTNNQYQKVRFTFGVTNHPSSSKYGGLSIRSILGFGGVGWRTPSNMAKTGHIYNYNSQQNAIFPANVQAPSFTGNLNGRASSAINDADNRDIRNRYFKIFNTSFQGGSSTVTVNDLAKDGPSYGMIAGGTIDNPSCSGPSTGGTWCHVLNLGWGKTNSNWVGQIALHSNGNTIWYRGNSDNSIVGKAWNKVLGSNNYTDYTVTKTGGGASGTWGINITGSAGSVAWSNVTGKPGTFPPSSHTHSYLPLSGGTMTGQIKKTTASSWIQARDRAIIRSIDSDSGSYHVLISTKTPSGSWNVGSLSERFYFSYDTDTNYNAGTNTSNTAVYIKNNGTLMGAAWNDYAEFRHSIEEYNPGTVVIETSQGLTKSTKRLSSGAAIVSDTFGFAIGETDEAKCPIAVSGRVLVYTDKNRNKFKPGDAVCAGKNGTVSKMNRLECILFPDRILGIVSEIPDYEEWGTGKVKVNGRIWIKVK